MNKKQKGITGFSSEQEVGRGQDLSGTFPSLAGWASQSTGSGHKDQDLKVTELPGAESQILSFCLLNLK